MKIKEIRKFNIEVMQNENIIYNGLSDEAGDEIKNLDIKQIVLKNKILKIEV
ncbi:MAG: hypothetical protein Q4D02_04510 [Clostridia bacterium]|nr:hypothetical protein [Clostridia bacterium]